MRIETLSIRGAGALWAHDGTNRPPLSFIAHSGPEGGPLVPDTSTTRRPVGTSAAPPRISRPAHHATTAAFLSACARYHDRRPDSAPSVAVLVMEPGRAGRVGIVAGLLDELSKKGLRIGPCIVGEPTSRTHAGDAIYNAGAGRVSGTMTVRGIQGHIAYPDLADNPIHRFGRILAEIESLGGRTVDVDGTNASVAVTQVRAGTGATNVIPGNLQAELDVHLDPKTAPRAFRRLIEAVMARHGSGHEVRWDPAVEPFRTQVGGLMEAVLGAIEDETGARPRIRRAPERTVASGVASERSPVLALGAVQTFVDATEPAAVAELDRLSRIYEGVIERLLST